MDFIAWNLSPFAQMLLRLLLSMIFFTSSINKIRQPQQFITAIASYDLLPKTWHKSLAITIICVEVAVSILLFLGWQSRTAAMLCILILFGFSCAIGINLIRGRTNLECGCFGRKHTQKISFGLIVRNLILAVAAYFVMQSGGGLLSLDSYPLFWARLLATQTILPFMFICVGISILFLLVRQLYRLLLLTPLEE
ncbi:MAG: DoxX family membrane protein [Anaerolineae bacterium]|nr:DoxX family membrane protein [Anaerolineae bacterium]